MKFSEFFFVLKPSPVGGIGVFATQDIPSGAQVSTDYGPRKMAIKDIPPAFLKYCIFLNDEECLCPKEFNRMEIGWYINHSDKANIADGGDHLVSIRDIKADEEIFLDYNQLDEPEHMKEIYYKRENTHQAIK